ncbi:MAG: restriction endonuclease subunit S, partial [Deltaproteobacteria bacterium]
MPEKKKTAVPRLRFPEFRDEWPWEVKQLGDTCEILDNMRKPVTSTKRKPGPYPYYGASGAIDYIDQYIFDDRLLLIGEDGAKWGAFERTAYIVEGKYWVNNHAHVVRPTQINDVLLENYLNASDISVYVTGAAPPKLTLDNLKAIRLPVPPKQKEQQKIADCLASLDELIRAEEGRLEALKTHKKGLMQQLFPAPGETTPRLRFPEFRDAGPWEVKR